MYAYATRGLGLTLAQPARSALPPLIETFLDQVRRNPEDNKLLLATAILHPRPIDSRFWLNKSFIAAGQKRYLIDTVLFTNVEEGVVLNELRRIAAAFQKRNPRFRKDIEAAVKLRWDLMNTLEILGRDREKLKPYLLGPLLPGSSESEGAKLERIGYSFAKAMFPPRLAYRMLHTLVFDAHYTTVGAWLRRYGEVLRGKDPAFNRLVVEKLRLMGK